MLLIYSLNKHLLSNFCMLLCQDYQKKKILLYQRNSPLVIPFLVPQVLLLFLLSFKFLLILSLHSIFSPIGPKGKGQKKLISHITRYPVGVLHVLYHNHLYGTIAYIYTLFKMRTVWLTKVHKLVQTQLIWMWYCRDLHPMPMFFPLKVLSKICLMLPEVSLHN